MNKTEDPKIGAFVLETLTTGMYINPLDSLREYIQNAFDSILEAERRKIISEGAGRIEISIDEKARSIHIKDNGLGIAASSAHSLLVNIGMSSKSIEMNAGFRGIGRLAGIAYCDKLIFSTKSKEEKEVSEISFDCVKLRESMSPSMREINEISDVLNRFVTHTKKNKVAEKESFFKVSMENIRPEGDLFLDWTKINAYLSQIAPVGFDEQGFHLVSQIYEWTKKRGIKVPKVSIIIKAKGGNVNFEVFKPYNKITYTTKENLKIHLKGIRFYPEDAGPESPFWLWYPETNCPGMIKDDIVSGFRLRKMNIGIGLSEVMTNIFSSVSESYARLNRWFMGEIYIQDHDVIPNARRDDFEEGKEWNSIKEVLSGFSRERSREAHNMSKHRNLDIDKLIKPVEQELAKYQDRINTGLASKKEQEICISRIDSLIQKLDSGLLSERADEEKTRIRETREELRKVREALETETSFTAQNLNASLDRKQRKIIKEVLEILYETLEDKEFEKAREAIMKKYQINEKDDK